MIFYYHELCFDLQLNTPNLFPCRQSQCFHELILFASESTYMRNSVYLEIEISLRVLFKRANRTVSLKVLSDLGRIEVAFNGNILERTQFLDKPIAKIQLVMQEVYCRHQLLHMWKIAFDKIYELGQLVVLLLVSVLNLLHLFGLSLSPLSEFFFKFKDAVLHIFVLVFQNFNLVTSPANPLLPFSSYRQVSVLV